MTCGRSNTSHCSYSYLARTVDTTRGLKRPKQIQHVWLIGCVRGCFVHTLPLLHRTHFDIFSAFAAFDKSHKTAMDSVTPSMFLRHKTKWKIQKKDLTISRHEAENRMVQISLKGNRKSKIAFMWSGALNNIFTACLLRAYRFMVLWLAKFLYKVD